MELKDQLLSIAESVTHLLPELILIASLVITLVLGLILKKNKQAIIHTLAVITYLIAIVIIIQTWPKQPVALFGGMMRLDDFSAFFKLLFLSGGILTILISTKRKDDTAPEFIVLLDAIILGSCLLASSMNFVMVLLSLELVSLSSYMLAGFGFDKKSAEGSMKYFLFGTVATACMIYGMSLIYGLSGTLDFSSDQFLNALIEVKSPLLLIASLLTLAGFLFKISAAPFHLWAPDVYESAPTPVVAFISIVPKLAGLTILVKFVLAVQLFGQSGFPWQAIIAAISIISILIGNLSALAQTNPKRMLAYSSVAQAGFLLIGVTVLGMEGLHFMLFYSTVFLLMNFLAFSVLNQYEESFEINSMTAFSGLGRLSFFPAFAILISMIALTGLPPTAGFTAKLLIFSSLWATYQETQSTILLALFIIGLMNTVISLFFYLKIPYFLFMKETAKPAEPIKNSVARNLLHGILVVTLIYLFLQPGGLMGWINRITFVL
ncbi:MAG: NADH-quinone oxidoreductase subunit N [Cyclobacteriaceae bacterium]|nr:NADH-quinone oxidoreductase subunit N [Cyclobacteriaceae bacterium]